MTTRLFFIIFGFFTMNLLNACGPHVPAMYTVDRTDDGDTGACTESANDCTLRGALNAANGSRGLDTIIFAVNGTIILGSRLEVSDDVTIHGDINGENIVLSGNNAVSGSAGELGQDLES